MGNPSNVLKKTFSCVCLIRTTPYATALRTWVALGLAAKYVKNFLKMKEKKTENFRGERCIGETLVRLPLIVPCSTHSSTCSYTLYSLSQLGRPKPSPLNLRVAAPYGERRSARLPAFLSKVVDEPERRIS